jgi:hypothetical protein
MNKKTAKDLKPSMVNNCYDYLNKIIKKINTNPILLNSEIKSMSEEHSQPYNTFNISISLGYIDCIDKDKYYAPNYIKYDEVKKIILKRNQIRYEKRMQNRKNIEPKTQVKEKVKEIVKKFIVLDIKTGKVKVIDSDKEAFETASEMAKKIVGNSVYVTEVIGVMRSSIQVKKSKY